jgi:hypothetical protein
MLTRTLGRRSGDLRTEEAGMPPGAGSKKRERQYDHIKKALRERGHSADEAEDIAARTVNKEHARHGEAEEWSRTSTNDISSGRRGGLRSHNGAGGAPGTSCTTRQEARESRVDQR